ncbi:terminase large subunit domain-containing protein [Bacteroidota bacterium]
MLYLTLPPLHDPQRHVLAHSRRFTAISGGRRWGKSRLGAYRCLEQALRGGMTWWVAPNYKMSDHGWRLIKAVSLQIPGVDVAETHKRITLPGRGVIQVRSADDPDSLRGEGLDFLVMDEAAYIKEGAWVEALRPALSDRRGSALFISTPAGRNWFWRQHCSTDQDHVSFTYPTSSNPHIDPKEIEQAEKTLPERTYRQEYLAEFMDDSGAVFRRLREAATATTRHEAEKGKRYVFGVDWARHHDFTVITVLDTVSSSVVHIDRFNQINYDIQIGRLEALFNRFKPFKVVAESNAMGEPLVEQLKKKGWNVESFTTTNKSKGEAIEGLVLAFEKEEIRIPNDENLINELQAFEMDRLPSGAFRYGAPSGMHDDMVMSLALAWHGRANKHWLVCY